MEGSNFIRSDSITLLEENENVNRFNTILKSKFDEIQITTKTERFDDMKITKIKDEDP